MTESEQKSDKPVIIGVGLTDESQYVLEKSVGLLGQPERVIAVHVLERPTLSAVAEAESMSLIAETTAEWRAEVSNKLSSLCENAQVTRFEIVEGNPAAELHRLARRYDARAIVVGSHGFHGWRAMLGETANSVLHGAPTDVHAIMSRDHTTNPTTEYKKILVPVDMTESAATVIATALRIRDRYDSDLELLGVVHQLKVLYPGVDSPAAFEATANFESEARAHCEKTLAEHCAKHGIERATVRQGDLAAEVHSMVTEDNFDLVVMGSHARRGLGLLFGAAPNDVLHGLMCDLYAVRL